MKHPDDILLKVPGVANAPREFFIVTKSEKKSLIREMFEELGLVQKGLRFPKEQRK
jgi:hypothetical protein